MKVEKGLVEIGKRSAGMEIGIGGRREDEYIKTH